MRRVTLNGVSHALGVVVVVSVVGCGNTVKTGGTGPGASESLAGAASSGPGTGNTTFGGASSANGGAASGSSSTSGGSRASGVGGAVSGGGANPSGGGGSPSGVVVELNATHQTIRGFGISSMFAPSNKKIPVDVLFGTSGADAIGLSILRVGMNPDGTFTGTYIAEAKAKGAKIIGTCSSPPASCKTNRDTQKGGHLLASCFDAWASTIADFAKQYGLDAMSIANEPDFASCNAMGPPCTNDYDSTEYTAKELVDWAKAAGKKLKEISPGTLVIAPEVAEWNHAWSNLSATGSAVDAQPHSSDPRKCGCFAFGANDTSQAANCSESCLNGDGYDYGHWLAKDPEAWAAFDIFGVHEYDSQTAFPWPSDVNGGMRNKEVWVTEMSGRQYWPEQGPSTDIGNAVAIAGWIHSALTVGEASAWVWFFYESYFLNDNQGLGIVKGGSSLAMRYYALGNYSKFVRPGFVAVEVAGNSNPDLLLSAYKGQAGELVVVAVNRSTSDVTLPISVVGGTPPAELTPTLTSASSKLVDGTPVPVMSGVFTATLPAVSVTTFSGK
jgi:glucuronoarabinoxylan endo-1,4-beta-xylanase